MTTDSLSTDPDWPRWLTSEDQQKHQNQRGAATSWAVGRARGFSAVSVCMWDDGHLVAAAKAEIERVPASMAAVYVPSLPHGQSVLLLRDIRAEPEGKGAGRLILKKLTDDADRKGSWMCLEAAPEGDIERTIAFFRRAGFTARNAFNQDCFYVRRWRSRDGDSR